MEKNNNFTCLKGVSTFVTDWKIIQFEPTRGQHADLRPQTRHGLIRMNSDGSFDVVRQPCYHAKSILIKDLPHGRLSETRDGCIQLTLKFDKDLSRIPSMMLKEATEACEALHEELSWL